MGKDIRRGKDFESEENESLASNSTHGKLKHTIEEQELNDVDSNTTYWESLPEDDEGKKVEPPQANPDTLADEAEIYRSEREEFGDKLQNVQKAMEEVLSIRELESMKLLQQGFDYDKIAFRMGITKATVQVLIERSRQKLLPYLNIE